MRNILRTIGLALAVSLTAACTPLISLYNLTIPKSGYRIVRDLPYGTEARQKLDLYIPDTIAPGAPVILFFYGGSWEGGSKNYYLAFGQAFASEGIIVAISDYRVFPDVRYPVFVEDSARAFAYVHNNIADHGGNPQRIFVAGHSAGAYNAMMLAAEERYLAAVGAQPDWIRGVIGIAGPYDFLPLKDKNLITIFGGAERPETQPIHHIDGARPPMFLATGADDTTVLPRNTYRLAEKLRSFDSPVKIKTYSDTAHIGILLSLAPGFRSKTSLREDILAFVNRH